MTTLVIGGGIVGNSLTGWLAELGVDVRDLARISEVRAALEPEAARFAAERASDVVRLP